MKETKAVTDNKEKAASRKKKDPLKVHLDKLDSLSFEDMNLTGGDISAYGDALSGGTRAVKSIKSAIDEAKGIITSAMYRHYCEHYAATGKPPEVRQSVSRTSTFQVVQYSVAEVTTETARKLNEFQGIDLDKFGADRSYKVKLGNVDKGKRDRVLASMKDILGEEYSSVVSEKVAVGEKFFDNFSDIVKSSLSVDERLDHKMLEVLRILSPTVQFRDFVTDLPEDVGFELALEYARISSKRKEASAAAAKAAKLAAKELKAAERLAAKDLREAERSVAKVAKAKAKAAEKEAAKMRSPEKLAETAVSG